MMFQIQPVYALLALILMLVIYVGLRKGRESETDLSDVFKGVLFQITRKLHVLIQKKQADVMANDWRPAFVAISSSSLSRLAPYDLLRWISFYYGFGTFFHFIKGFLTKENSREAKELLDRLIKQGVASDAGIYADTIISPSFKTAVAQIIQTPGVFGIENNSILFEFHEDEHEKIMDIIDGCKFADTVGYSICVLRSSGRHFGYKRTIHIWLTPGDYKNANLMILLAYILMGHPEWKGCEIDIFAAYFEEDADRQIHRLNRLIDLGRIPIAQKNVKKLPYKKGIKALENLVNEHSIDADLVISGFSLSKLEEDQGAFFKSFSEIEEILFVRAGQRIVISEE